MTQGSDNVVFLSHNSRDKPAVEEIQRRLESCDPPFRCWLDKDDLRSRDTWMTQIESVLGACESAALFFGPSGRGPIHELERQKLIDRAARQRDSFWLVPVLLPDANKEDVDGFTSLFNWVDFVAGLDSPAALDRLAKLLRGEAPGTVSADDQVAGQPYRGLERFDSDHAEYFFGRDEEIRRLCGAIESKPFVAVIGASGSGKSSLVRAGLQTELAHRLLPKLATATTITVLPGSDPLRSLAEQLAASVIPAERRESRPDKANEYTRRFREENNGLGALLGSLFPHDDDFVLLVVDQFEEVFTHSREQQGTNTPSAKFLAELCELVVHPSDRVRLLITLRSDFQPRCLDYAPLRTMFQNQHNPQLLLGELERSDLREIIVRPAQLAGGYFEKGLVERILDDVEDRRGSLPLLEHALKELWAVRSGRWLTNDAYTATGGVAGALRKRADKTLKGLTDAQRDIAKNVFLRLTTLGEGTNDTRRRVPVEELYPANELERGEVAIVIDKLRAKDARLIVTNDDATAEVTHEALMQSWDQLKNWLNANREEKRLHDRLRDAARDWFETAPDAPGLRDATYLWEGGRLEDAESFSRENSRVLNDLESKFLAASFSRRRQKLVAAKRNQRTLSALAFVAVLAAIGAIILWRKAAHLNSELIGQTASALLSPIGVPLSDSSSNRKPQALGELEAENLVTISNSSAEVRVQVLDRALESDSEGRLLERLEPLTVATIGIDPVARANAIDRYFPEHLNGDYAKSMLFRLAAHLEVGWPGDGSEQATHDRIVEQLVDELYEKIGTPEFSDLQVSLLTLIRLSEDSAQKCGDRIAGKPSSGKSWIRLLREVLEWQSIEGVITGWANPSGKLMQSYSQALNKHTWRQPRNQQDVNQLNRTIRKGIEENQGNEEIPQTIFALLAAQVAGGKLEDQCTKDSVLFAFEYVKQKIESIDDNRQLSSQDLDSLSILAPILRGKPPYNQIRQHLLSATQDATSASLFNASVRRLRGFELEQDEFSPILAKANSFRSKLDVMKSVAGLKTTPEASMEFTNACVGMLVDANARKEAAKGLLTLLNRISADDEALAERLALASLPKVRTLVTDALRNLDSPKSAETQSLVELLRTDLQACQDKEVAQELLVDKEFSVRQMLLEQQILKASLLLHGIARTENCVEKADLRELDSQSIIAGLKLITTSFEDFEFFCGNIRDIADNFLRNDAKLALQSRLNEVIGSLVGDGRAELPDRDVRPLAACVFVYASLDKDSLDDSVQRATKRLVESTRKTDDQESFQIIATAIAETRAHRTRLICFVTHSASDGFALKSSTSSSMTEVTTRRRNGA